MSTEGALLIIFGLVIVVSGIFGKGPFYNTVDMPLTKHEKNDTRSPTMAERAGYMGFGVLLILFGVWKSF